MLGVLYLGTEYGHRVKAERGRLCGLRVWSTGVNDRGILGHTRVRKAAKLLHRAGVDRLLTQEDFPCWEEMRAAGIGPVDPIPFLQHCAPELLCAALERQGMPLSECIVSLRGQRADRAMRAAAMELCPLVRELCISAPQGGEALSAQLRWTFGAAVCPDTGRADGVVRFDGGASREGRLVMDLFGKNPELHGVQIRREGETLPGKLEQIPLLAALWTGGLVKKEELKMT